MESDLAGDYSDEISKGNWMRQPLSFPFDNFKYKIFREIVSEQTRGKELKDGRCVIRLIRKMELEF